MNKYVRYLCFCLCLLFLVSMTGCTQNPEHKTMSGKTPGFESLEAMEAYSDLIIRATRTEKEKPVATYSEGHLVSGYTFSSVVISEIYADKSGIFQVGDEIDMLENQIYSEEENAIYHLNGYQMMEPGREYLLFLEKSSTGNYYISAGILFGTISLEKDGRMSPVMTRSGEPIGNFEYYIPIWNAALEKYT